MQHEKINYLEFPASDLNKVKAFYHSVFGFEFVDYGAQYTAFSNAGIDGGFYLTDKTSNSKNGAVLVVFYSENLLATQHKIIAAGGEISLDTFSFPGGQRFHFLDCCGNELAVWSEK